jgi:hypothetical protein
MSSNAWIGDMGVWIDWVFKYMKSRRFWLSMLIALAIVVAGIYALQALDVSGKLGSLIVGILLLLFLLTVYIPLFLQLRNETREVVNPPQSRDDESKQLRRRDLIRRRLHTT